jgi:hypothetical protein
MSSFKENNLILNANIHCFVGPCEHDKKFSDSTEDREFLERRGIVGFSRSKLLHSMEVVSFHSSVFK